MSGSQNEADDVLRAWLSNNPSVVGYVVVNSDGIPIRNHEKLSRERSVHYASLLTNDLASMTAAAFRDLLFFGAKRGDLTTIRLRTAKGLEIITCQIASGYSLIAIQNCTDKPYVSGDAAQVNASDAQEAERDA
ncbi:roadblock/LC7 domain-containing protein, putative [Eimeria praecox]|uniref:Roadblock/LC7 domain-containing protein, putative n=1 Tax=Eimeria praecox TaxID=51316 RepID=U6GQQ2_9EIME|nr:roadblock/LC7 domain-containing protein, putative [Eimeria praecox]